MTDFTERLSRLSTEQLQKLANQLVETSSSRTQLVAYVVSDKPVESSELRAHCKRRLPDYMLPQRFELVHELPLTATGKVDYQKLKTNGQISSADSEAQLALSSQAVFEPGVAKSDDELIARLTEVWCDVLQMDRIYPDDDYFELGGDSIANLQIIARCAKFDIHLSPADILQNPTIELLAQWLKQTTSVELADPSLSREPPAASAADATVTDQKTKAEMLRVLNLGRDR